MKVQEIISEIGRTPVSDRIFSLESKNGKSVSADIKNLFGYFDISFQISLSLYHHADLSGKSSYDIVSKDSTVRLVEVEDLSGQKIELLPAERRMVVDELAKRLFFDIYVTTNHN